MPVFLNWSDSDSTIPSVSQSPRIAIKNFQTVDFENIGTTVEVIVNGSTSFDGKDYSLKQFHFHTPSEHHINGEYFPLELHMVHQARDSSIVVLGVLFDVTDTFPHANIGMSKLLRTLAQSVERISMAGQITSIPALNLSPLNTILSSTSKSRSSSSSSSFWPFLSAMPRLVQYTGSLTTPPCTEGVQFVLATQPLPVLDVDSYKALRRVLRYNSRNTQVRSSRGAGGDNLLEMACKTN